MLSYTFATYKLNDIVILLAHDLQKLEFLFPGGNEIWNCAITWHDLAPFFFCLICAVISMVGNKYWVEICLYFYKICCRCRFNSLEFQYHK